MSGEEPSDIPKFTGFSKYFNSFTTRGRANCSMATYATVALVYLYFKLKPSKKQDS